MHYGGSLAGLNFHGILSIWIFVVQGQSTYILDLKQKIHSKNFRTALKICENRESLAQ